MLKNVNRKNKNLIYDEQAKHSVYSAENWDTSNYQYDSDSYNYDEADLSDVASISTAYMDICALSNATTDVINGLGKVTNSNNVKNVDLSGMNRVTCVKGINESMSTMMSQYGKFVNACYEKIGNNGLLFTDQDGTKIDNYAEYLKEYAQSGSLSDVINGGFEGLKMSNYGEFVSQAGDSNSNRPHFEGEAILPDGSVNPEYAAYVNSIFYNEEGECKFEGVTIKGDIKINPSNGNVQVNFVDAAGIPFSLNCNLSNSNSLDNAYVSLPGDSGGAVYGSDNYSSVLNKVQYNSTNRFISFVFGAPSDHPAANAAITQIVDALNGETNLNKSVVSAASASEVYALDAVEALMTQSNSVDVMLLDSVRPGSEVCENFTKMLLGEKLKDTKIRNGKVIVNGYYKGKDYSDVLSYLQEKGTVYAYVAQRGNSPSDAGSWLQQLGNNGVRTVMCTNNHYTAHVDVEYQIFNGELERVFNEFNELPSSNSSDGLILISSVQTSAEEENPYSHVEAIDLNKLYCQENNEYIIYEEKSKRRGEVSDVADLHRDTVSKA